MIRVALRSPDDPARRAPKRGRFGLETALPADPRIIERAVLRHLATCRPDVVVLALTRAEASGAQGALGPVDLAQGIPDLMLLLPGGRTAFVVIKAQAGRLSRAERAFADLCRTRAIPVDVVRSLPEARRAFDRLGLSSRPETRHGLEESDLSRRAEGSHQGGL